MCPKISFKLKLKLFSYNRTGRPIRQKKKCLFPITWQKKFGWVGRIKILFYFQILFFRVTVATHDDIVDLWDGVADLSNACSINKRPLFPQESGRKRSFSVQSTRFTSFHEDMLISQGKDRDRSSRRRADSSRRHFDFRRKHRRAENYPNKIFFSKIWKKFRWVGGNFLTRSGYRKQTLFFLALA